MRPVYGHKYHLHNWVDDFDVVCASELETGLIGSASFAGLFIGALILSPISDKYGRKPSHFIGLVLYLIGCIPMYFFPSHISVTIGSLINGMGLYSRLVVSYIYLLELVDD